jgi:hypothetical protein
MRTSAKLVAAAVMAAALMVLEPGIASAHQEKDVGPYTMAVGFGTEPDAYAGQPNSVQLLLTKGKKPVTDLGDSLQVTITFGDQTSDAMSLEPYFEIGEWGIPGDYRVFFVPSQAGDYTFHFTGTIGSTKVDESFTSGPKTFSTVKDMESATFPQVQYPTNADLASRIEAESARTAKQLATVTSAANDASDAASSAKTIGIIGIVVGAVGLIVAVVALTRKRS